MLRPLPNTALLTPSGTTLPPPMPVAPPRRIHALRSSPAPRILDWDVENRPLSFKGKDFTTDDVTAIAWAWTDLPEWVMVRTLKPPPDDLQSRRDMLSEFAAAYEKADVVTGHYILGHDLALVSGMLVEFGLPPLGPKLVSDTYCHLRRIKGVGKSQENLAAMLGVDAPKIGMSDYRWREANRLTPEGIGYARERVTGDVRQHLALRTALLERGLLGAARWWNPGGARRAA